MKLSRTKKHTHNYLQLLETGFLHADPHPGNLMRSNDGRIVILDFGLMTEVGPDGVRLCCFCRPMQFFVLEQKLHFDFGSFMTELHVNRVCV
jgi:tRNA A-37 threonylcarbamoyl transferase component Bud32